MRRTSALIKFIFTTGLLFILIGLIILREKDISTIIHNYILQNSQNITIGEKNEYYRNYDFTFVQNTESFSPSNYQDILNIYYTVLNAGKTSFTFYCPRSYENCLKDVQILANNQDLLSDINNYVHPFNGFSHIETEYDTLGRVTIQIIKSYKEDQIQLINQKVDELYPLLVQENVPLEDNIRSIHDYIINHSRYDSQRSDYSNTMYHSDIAYGPLFEGYAVCGGYTDLMELFLEKLNVKNFKVSSDSHIWNAILMGERWYHLDLTWDDPVASDGKDYLEHNYFLVNTTQLLDMERTQHNFNLGSYPELN